MDEIPLVEVKPNDEWQTRKLAKPLEVFYYNKQDELAAAVLQEGTIILLARTKNGVCDIDCEEGSYYALRGQLIESSTLVHNREE